MRGAIHLPPYAFMTYTKTVITGIYKSVGFICLGDMPINALNAELNPICHFLELLGGATIVVVSRLRVKDKQ